MNNKKSYFAETDEFKFAIVRNLESAEEYYAILDYANQELSSAVIPDEVESMKVKIISWEAFRSHNKLSSVGFPNSLHIIEDRAFQNCENLKTLDNFASLPLLKEIGDHSFTGCKKLILSSFPDGLRRIGKESFENCDSIQSLHFPESIRLIGNRAFLGCTNLSEAYFTSSSEHSDMTVEIKSEAFSQCSNLHTVHLPNNLLIISTGLFWNCTSLSTVIISSNLVSIEESAFQDCSSLKRISFPNTLEIIESSAFKNCTALESIQIPENIKRIGKDAFHNCPNIKHVWFNSNLINRPDADEIFLQLFEAGLHTREVLLKAPTVQYVSVSKKA